MENIFLLLWVWEDIKIVDTITIMTRRRKLTRFEFLPTEKAAGSLKIQICSW